LGWGLKAMFMAGWTAVAILIIRSAADWRQSVVLMGGSLNRRVLMPVGVVLQRADGCQEGLGWREVVVSSFLARFCRSVAEHVSAAC
jgi:hypothetical protein